MEETQIKSEIKSERDLEDPEAEEPQPREKSKKKLNKHSHLPGVINGGVILSLTIGGAVIGGVAAGPVGVAPGAAMGKEVADAVIAGATIITREITKVIEDD